MISWLNTLAKQGVFFKIKDNELKVLTKHQNLDKALIEEIKSRKQEIKEYLQSQPAFNSGVDFQSIPVIDEQESYSLSDAQKRLWVLTQIEQKSTLYNMPSQILLQGDYNIDNFKKAIYAVIDRHEILRTIFKEDEKGEIRQWILEREALDFTIIHKDFSKEENPGKSAREYIQTDIQKPFNLSEGPLLRFALLQIQNDTYVFYFNMHHIIGDGWSMEVLKKDAIQYYNAFMNNTPPALPTLEIQYKDYASWQLSQTEESTFEESKTYWMDKFSGELATIDLSTRKKRPLVRTNNGGKLFTTINADLANKLRSYSQSHKATLFTGLLSILNVTIHKYTKQSDLIVGTNFSGRYHKQLENQIGFYMNAIALRNQINTDDSFETFFKIVNKNTQEAFSNQKYPFHRLVNDLKLKRDTSRNALFDIRLVLQNDGDKKEAPKNGINETIQYAGEIDTKIDLEIVFEELGDYLQFEILYNSDVYEKETIENFMCHFKNLLHTCLETPSAKIFEIEYLSEKEKKKILHTFNDTKVAYDSEKTVLDLFQKQVKSTPNAIVLDFENETLSYKELDIISNQFANYLIELGITKETLIPISTERSLQTIIAILGILKAGGAYVPIDPSYPQQRINFILEDTKAKYLVTQSHLLEKFATQKDTIHIIAIDQEIDKITQVNAEAPTIKVASNELIYVIYTSGTTGKPKGVLCEHKGILNLALNQIEKMELSEEDKTLQFASISFDAFGSELYATLISGGQLVMVSESAIKSKDKISSIIKDKKITVAVLPPSYQVVLNNSLQSLRVIVSAGEALNIPQTQKLQDAGVKIINGYGPTENSVCTSMSLHPVQSQNTATIGKPLNNVQVYVLNEDLQLVPIGIVGELCTSGIQIARGYLNREALSDEKFVDHPFIKGEKLYKTGDLARWLPDGNLEFLGRKDDQIKIRGYRVELEEIEAQLLQIENVDQATIVVKTFGEDQKQLIAFITSSTISEVATIEKKLKEALPEYMVPSVINLIEEMPLTTNGKIDKKLLLKTQERTTVVNNVFTDNNNIERKLLEIWGKLLHQEPQTIDVNTGFFQMGGNSLLIMEMHQEIKKVFPTDIQIAALFQNATVALQVELLKNEFEAEKQIVNEVADVSKISRLGREENADIAVIGMAIKTPGANNVKEFWNNLKGGVESLKYFTDEELEKAGVSKNVLEDENYVKAGFFMDGKENFDSSFFGYLPDEAKVMDPQTRIFHEIVWEALEDAGYDPHVYKGSIGLFAGSRANLNWEIYSMLTNDPQKVNAFTAAQLQNKDFANSLIAYKLNFKGGVYTLNTACSTSLVAIHRAVDSLLSGENNIALAGGISLKKNFDRGYYYQEGMINSKDAHNKAFDNNSNGTVESEGAGIVVLKKLEDAKRDGDNIVAVIKGSAINNDGNRKVGYTAPSLDGQIEVIKKAQQLAGVHPKSISYIEAHGTATRLGDTIEFEALTKVFDQAATKYCALGTVKSNLGHMDTAAGVGGFIKTILCLQHKKLVPSLHFSKPNTNLDYETSPFYVNTEYKDWEKEEDTVLRAGISSFGIGGTNAHIVVEEFVTEESEIQTDTNQVFVISAKTQEALKLQKENLLQFVEENEEMSVANIAFTLQTGRKSFSQRASFVVNSINDLKEKLQNAQQVTYGAVKEGKKKVIFMFPGQGTQYLNMGRDLYKAGGIFAEVMDMCFEIVQKQHHKNLKELVFTKSKDASVINQTKNTQPLLFIIEYALAKQLQHFGIQPDAMIGHSIGEYVAACISGVLSLEDALKLVVLRGEMIQNLPKGTMISINLSAEEVEPFLNTAIDIAAINTQDGCVLSGDFEDIEQFKTQLDDFEVNYKDLHTSHAFHSQMMLPIAEEFTKVVKDIQRNAPQIPYISNVTGKEITAEMVQDDNYWFNHIRKTVRYADGLKTIFKIDNDLVCVEVGPSKTLSNFVRQNQPEKRTGIHVVNLMRHPKEVKDDAVFFLSGIGKMWTKGVEINWKQVHGEQQPKKISLPTYPFAKIKYPIGESLEQMIAERMTVSNTGKQIDTSKWFYQPTWQSENVVFTETNTTSELKLVFMDTYGYGDCMMRAFAENENVIQVIKGTEFKQLNDKQFTINPNKEEEYKLLFETLETQQKTPSTIVSLWQINKDDHTTSESGDHTDFYNTLYLVKAIARNVASQVRLTIITNNTCQIIGHETVEAEKAILKKIVLITPQENTNITTQCIDIVLSEAKEEVSQAIINELKILPEEMFIGYRFNKRWIQKYTPITLEKPTKEQINIQSEGVYLITGGLGALGIIYAEYLLKNYNASLLLVGRSILSENQAKQEKLEQLQALGTVKYIQVDISDEAQLSAVIKEAEATLGTINGIIHAAGLIERDAMKAVNFTTKTLSEKHFASKIKGTNALVNIFKTYELDFCVFTSSLAAIVGGKETMAYAAANAYMDEISNAKLLKNSVTINYDGLNFNNETYEYGLNQEEAVEVLEYVLGQKILTQVIVSTGDLTYRLDQSLENNFEEKTVGVDETIQELEINRTNLSTVFEEAKTNIEKELTRLFVDFFGMKGIGIYDDFFELGGDSLKAMSLSNSIHKNYNIELGLKDFFENPNIQALAKEIESLQEAQKEAEIALNTKYEDII
ncbi:amino acid adenylation domain-containing protein [Kordia sp.]|uniref:amino acid adenylation domain-containing protein n=1 Tax=Kordia sp. TaxID=1965332 RepID=UPI003B5A4D54